MNGKIKLGFCSPDTKPDSIVIINLDEEKLIEVIKAGLLHENSYFKILVDED